MDKTLIFVKDRPVQEWGGHTLVPDAEDYPEDTYVYVHTPFTQGWWKIVRMTDSFDLIIRSMWKMVRNENVPPEYKTIVLLYG